MPAPKPHKKPKDDKVIRFHARLEAWYRTNGRHDLPWRHTDNAYHILVSEVMLQQTQVKTVLERYYHPFLKQFPTMKTLATAPQEAVLKAWQGMGYYRRAVNLHVAAKQAKGTMPETAEALLALPGVGQNTARAVMAFAYHQPYAVMEANVKRMLCRIFAMEKADAKLLWKHADDLLNRDAPFDYNQAMMDVGAAVCTPTSPHCDVCPANNICAGKASPTLYPQKQAKKAIPTRHITLVICEDVSGKLYLPKRQTKLLGGLHGFVELEHQKQLVLGKQSFSLAKATPLGSISHTYSHFKLMAQVLHLQTHHASKGANWYSANALAALPLSRADEKALALYTRAIGATGP